jgi:hypothetical protein
MMEEDDDEINWLDSLEPRKQEKDPAEEDCQENAHMIRHVVDWELDTVVSSREAEETMVGETKEEFLAIPKVGWELGSNLSPETGSILADADKPDRLLLSDVSWDLCTRDPPKVAETSQDKYDIELTRAYSGDDIMDPAFMIPLSPLSTSIIFTHHLLLLFWLCYVFFQI